MKTRKLLQLGERHFEAHSNSINNVISANVFYNGGIWMAQQQNILKQKEIIAKNTRAMHFNYYGYLKYILSFAIFIISFFVLLSIHFLLAPIAFICFYIVEIHFLFLFPIIIDQRKNPILQSIKLTYKIGFVICLFKVMHIGLYMLFGLLNFKNPLKKWYIGCLAILIWYNYETANR